MLGQRRWQMHDQPPGRGQVRPTGYTRKPPCVVPADPLLFPADQRQTHGLSSGKGRIRHVPSVGSREASSIDNVLHLGLRVFLVGVDPLCTGGLSQSGRKLRALSCRARRTGAHGGQGWSAGPVSQNGSVACCARMVRGGVAATCCACRRRSGAQHAARCRIPLCGRTRCLARNLLDLRNRSAHSRSRRGVGGARLEGLCRPSVTKRPIRAGREPHPRRPYRRLASASDGGWAGSLLRHCADCRRSDRLQLGIQ